MPIKTFREVADAWLLECRKRVAATTYDRYKATLERDVYPFYADVPADDVTYAAMNSFISDTDSMERVLGRPITRGALQLIQIVMRGVISYYLKLDEADAIVISGDATNYEALSIDQIKSICKRAKIDHSPAMLAILLHIFCGVRNGELSALNCDDIDLDSMTIYIHSTARRIKNQDPNSHKKTVLVIEEISVKSQKRTVLIPSVLKSYVAEFILSGRPLIHKEDGSMVDPRTLEKWIDKALRSINLTGINSERLRATYRLGKADGSILRSIFLGDEDTHKDVSEYRMIFSDRLASLRKKSRVSASEISLAIGMDEDYISCVEAGTEMPTMDVFFSICSFLQIKPYEFFADGATTSVSDSVSAMTDKSLLTDMASLPKERLGVVSELVRMLG